MPAMLGIGMWMLTLYGIYRLVRRLFRKRRGGALPALTGGEAGFVPSLYDSMCGDRTGIAIDTTNNRLAVYAGGQRRVLNFEQIIRVEAMLNGAPMSQGGGKVGMMGAAFVGDLIAGPLGGIAMAAAAANLVQHLSLRLLTDDLAQPWLDVVFLDEKHPRNVKRKNVQVALGQWKAWEGRLLTIVHRHPTLVVEERPIRQFVA